MHDWLHLDFETRSELDLTKVGTDRYARHPSTQGILLAWAYGSGPVEQVDLTIDEFPAKLRMMLSVRAHITKVAHNAAFEMNILEHVYGIRIDYDQWYCTMAWAYMIGLPGKLKKLCEVVKVPEHMSKFDGDKLIKIFCVPQKRPKRPGKKPFHRWRDGTTDPELWEKFKEYNKQDVETERFICEKRLAQYMPSEKEWEMWSIDQRINRRGWPIDREYVRCAASMVDEIKAETQAKLIKLTGLENPNSDKQFGPWIRERGYTYGDLRKGTIQRYLDDPEQEIPPLVEKVLTLRRIMKRTAVTKYAAVLDRLPDDPNDDFLRYTFQFSGAQRTGRWAGRVPQFHNLVKPPKHLEDPRILADIIEAVKDNNREWLKFLYGDEMLALSAALRGMVRAPEGKTLVVADLASIESVVIAWLARCKSMLDVFYNDLDIYKSFGVKLFGKPYNEITKQERNWAKPGVLGCGFRLSGGELVVDSKTGDLKKTGLWGYAESMKIDLTRDQAHESVAVFRESYPEIVQFWYDLERAAKQTIHSHQEHTVGLLTFSIKGPFLRMRLPSGRFLYYLRPKIEQRRTPYGKYKPTITYEGMEDKGDRKVWGRIPTHGGKIAENATQAVANDILRYGLKVSMDTGIDVCGHVHDEAVAMEDEIMGFGVNDLINCLVSKESWMKGLPLKAAGFTSPFYRKD